MAVPGHLLGPIFRIEIVIRANNKMLLVRTKLSPSPIHGIGLFADQLIPQGTKTWRFQPNFDLEKTLEEIAGHPEHIRDWFKHYGYVDERLGKCIVCVDDARFMNHSYNPTVRPDYSLDRYGVDIAVCDIQPGDEITIDYRLIEQNR